METKGKKIVRNSKAQTSELKSPRRPLKTTQLKQPMRGISLCPT